MPLRIFQRPDLPYDNESKHNDQRYGLLSARGKPPTSEMLDADYDYIIDSMDILSQDIQDVQAGVIVGSDDPNNANKLLTTDGNNTGWTFINANNIQDGAISTVKIGANAIVTTLLGDGSVTAPKLATNAITNPKLAPDSVTGVKVQNTTLPLTKLVHDQTGGFVFSRTGSTAIELLTVLDTDRWKLPVRIDPPAAAISMQYLDVIWTNNPSSFTGTKLTNASTPLNKLLATANSSIVISGANENTYKELVVSDLDRWKVPSRGDGDSQVQMKTLDEVWNNTANDFNGNKLQNGSILDAKISSVSQSKVTGLIPLFSSGNVNANGSTNRAFNAAIARISQGKYRITFNTAASGIFYPISITTDDNGGNIGLEATIQNRNVNSFDVLMYGFNTGNYDSGFSFIVFDS